MTEYIDVFEDASIEGDEEIIQEALEEFIWLVSISGENSDAHKWGRSAQIIR